MLLTEEMIQEESEKREKVEKKLNQVLKIRLSEEEMTSTVLEIVHWVDDSEDFDRGFWLGLKNCGIGRYAVRDRYHAEYDKVKPI